MTGRRDGEGEGARGQPTSSRASFAPAPLATEPLRLGPPRRAAASLPLVPGCAHPCLALRLASSPGCADPRAPTMLYASDPTQHFASVGVLRVSILLGGLEGAFAVAEGSEGFLSIVPLPRRAPATGGGATIQVSRGGQEVPRGWCRRWVWRWVPAHPGAALGTSPPQLGRINSQGGEGGGGVSSQLVACSPALGRPRLRVGRSACLALLPAAGAQRTLELVFAPRALAAVRRPPPALRTRASSPGRLLVRPAGQAPGQGLVPASLEASCCLSESRGKEGSSLRLAPVA